MLVMLVSLKLLALEFVDVVVRDDVGLVCVVEVFVAIDVVSVGDANGFVEYCECCHSF